MPRITDCPVALTIAGSDSGGGAGIQADLKTFAAFRVHGASAVACLTAQNPWRVHAMESVSAKMLRHQIEAVFEELHPVVVKTGMLLSSRNIRIVANCLKSRGRPPLVVDPVMLSTSGVRLLESTAITTLKKQLLPRATLITPNLPETEILIGKKITSIEHMRIAAREIYRRFGCAAVIKGGHLTAASKRHNRKGGRGTREAVDVFFDGDTELLLGVPFIKNIHTHGTGCTYSAAIAAALALGHDLPQAVRLAKNYITGTIARSYHIGKHSALNHFFCRRVYHSKTSNETASRGSVTCRTA